MTLTDLIEDMIEDLIEDLIEDSIEDSTQLTTLTTRPTHHLRISGKYLSIQHETHQRQYGSSALRRETGSVYTTRPSLRISDSRNH
jgi:hypothetical protein